MVRREAELANHELGHRQARVARFDILWIANKVAVPFPLVIDKRNARDLESMYERNTKQQLQRMYLVQISFRYKRKMKQN